MYHISSWSFSSSSLINFLKSQIMLNMLMGLNRSLQWNYLNGKPFFLADPSRSIFKILNDSEFWTCPIRKIQEILQTKHIIVMDWQMQDYNFDERGLRALRPLNEPITIQDWLGFHGLILSLMTCFQKNCRSINWPRKGWVQWETNKGGNIMTDTWHCNASRWQNYECPCLSPCGHRLPAKLIFLRPCCMDANSICSIFKRHSCGAGRRYSMGIVRYSWHVQQWTV